VCGPAKLSVTNCTQVITCDFRAYEERNGVERMFNRLKQFRRIATRYDKTAPFLPEPPGARRRKATNANFLSTGLGDHTLVPLQRYQHGRPSTLPQA
jgi:transposase